MRHPYNNNFSDDELVDLTDEQLAALKSDEIVKMKQIKFKLDFTKAECREEEFKVYELALSGAFFVVFIPKQCKIDCAAIQLVAKRDLLIQLAPEQITKLGTGTKLHY